MAQRTTRMHKVWILDCNNCDTFLTNRGMKAVLLLRPNVPLYSTDALPLNCSQPSESSSSSKLTSHRTCECLTQSLSCHGCGSPIGYMIVVPCLRCTSSVLHPLLQFQPQYPHPPFQQQTRTTNGHRFVFHSSQIHAHERLYIAGEPGIIIDADIDFHLQNLSSTTTATATINPWLLSHSHPHNHQSYRPPELNLNLNSNPHANLISNSSVHDSGIGHRRSSASSSFRSGSASASSSNSNANSSSTSATLGGTGSTTSASTGASDDTHDDDAGYGGPSPDVSLWTGTVIDIATSLQQRRGEDDVATDTRVVPSSSSSSSLPPPSSISSLSTTALRRDEDDLHVPLSLPLPLPSTALPVIGRLSSLTITSPPQSNRRAPSSASASDAGVHALAGVNNSDSGSRTPDDVDVDVNGNGNGSGRRAISIASIAPATAPSSSTTTPTLASTATTAPPRTPTLAQGDVLHWHHLARSGELPPVRDDVRARRGSRYGSGSGSASASASASVVQNTGSSTTPSSSPPPPQRRYRYDPDGERDGGCDRDMTGGVERGVGLGRLGVGVGFSVGFIGR